MPTLSRKKYNNFFEKNGMPLESKDPEIKVVLLGTNLYFFKDEFKCYVINSTFSYFLKEFAAKYDLYQVMPYSSKFEEIMWEEFNASSKFDVIADKYELTDAAQEILKKAIKIDVYRETSRDYLLKSKIKPIYLSRVFNNEIDFEINPKLGFWNNQIWSITDSFARLEINNVSSILNDGWRQSHIAMLGQPDHQTNPLEQKLKKKDKIVFLKDDLGREGFLTVENIEKLKSICNTIKVYSYDDLK